MPFSPRTALWGVIGFVAIMCAPAGCFSLPVHGSPPEGVAAGTSSVAPEQPRVTLYVGEG